MTLLQLLLFSIYILIQHIIRTNTNSLGEKLFVCFVSSVCVCVVVVFVFIYLSNTLYTIDFAFIDNHPLRFTRTFTICRKVCVVLVYMYTLHSSQHSFDNLQQYHRHPPHHIHQVHTPSRTCLDEQCLRQPIHGGGFI